MRIPAENSQRIQLFNEILHDCLVSRQERMLDYETHRTYFLYGSPDGVKTSQNQLADKTSLMLSYIFSQDGLRFSASFDRFLAPIELISSESITREWKRANSDEVFQRCLTWASVYNSTIFQALWVGDGIKPYMISPHNFGVLNEAVMDLDDQEAFVHVYEVSLDQLERVLINHPGRDEILARLSVGEPQQGQYEGLARLVIAASNLGQQGGSMAGYLRNGTAQEYSARTQQKMVELCELWIWNDDTDDYQIVTMAGENVVIFDRKNFYLKGDHPFVHVCIDPVADYFWGASITGRVETLQDIRVERMMGVRKIMRKQIDPPFFISGIPGITDEKVRALQEAGSYIYSQMPNGTVNPIRPEMPQDIWAEIKEIDNEFDMRLGLANILGGQGEPGVRSADHAFTLANLAASRIIQQALKVERILEKIGTLYWKLMHTYDGEHVYHQEGLPPFMFSQIQETPVITVEAHTASPIFKHDQLNQAALLFKAGAMDAEDLLDVARPANLEYIKRKLKQREKVQQEIAMHNMKLQEEAIHAGIEKKISPLVHHVPKK